MPQFIIKLVDEKTSTPYYFMWSTVVDAPVTEGMELEEFKSYYHERFGSDGDKALPERLNRVEKTGTSAFNDTLDDLINHNRAGENEQSLTKQQIIKAFT